MREMTLALLLCATMGGCSHNTDQICDGGTCPITTGGDGPATGPDLSVPSPDLIGQAAFQYATNGVTLPTKAMPFAIDIDGDGKPDNAFSGVTSALAAFLDLQKTVDAAVKSGNLVLLHQIIANDPTSGNNVPVGMDVAAPGTKPKYDGTDHFTIPQGEVAANLKGQIQAGMLSTIVPTKLTGADVQKIAVSLPVEMDSLPLTLYGVHVQGTVDKTGIMSGQVHGVVRKKDIDGQIIPAVATLLTHSINADPMGSDLVIGLIEDLSKKVSQDKCKVDADCCHKSPTTCKILPEEVSGNGLISGILKPDVQVFDGDTWKPTPGGKNPDSLSVGFAFTSVRASF